MNRRISYRWLGLVTIIALIGGTVFVQPLRVEAQCATTKMNMTSGGLNTVTIVLMGAALPGSCMQTTAMNVSSCDPGPAGDMITTLYARAQNTAVNPSCGWSCMCGPGSTTQTVTATTADGLPVELMDFKVTAVPQTPSPLEELSKTESLVSPRS